MDSSLEITSSFFSLISKGSLRYSVAHTYVFHPVSETLEYLRWHP